MLKDLFLGFYFIYTVKGASPRLCGSVDIVGKWIFHIAEPGPDEWIDCSAMQEVNNTYKLELKHPNVVVDEFDNEGTWTMVYDMGFEVTIHGRKFFAYSNAEGYVVKKCDQTAPGRTHDVFGRAWSCFYGIKDYGNMPTANDNKQINPHFTRDQEQPEDKHDRTEIQIESNNPALWFAKNYDTLDMKTLRKKRMIIKRKKLPRPSSIYEASPDIKTLSNNLPEKLDWRNVNGINYITPVRNQGKCSSCYAIASTGMNEARLRVATKNTLQVTLSPQDILDCSVYNFGCEGGLPYLTAGKHAEDYGMVEEQCNPYRAKEALCSLKNRANCTKHYFTNYEYIGGYFGACNDDLMKIAVATHGPIVASLFSDDQLDRYGGGIFHQIGKQSDPSSFNYVNHAVLIVGYDIDKTTNTKYWTAKNSLGEHWGENGYFRIQRGTNELGIESMAVQSFPIF